MLNPIPLSPRTWPTWLGVAVLSIVWLLPRFVRSPLATLLAQVAIRLKSGTNRAIAINIQACFPELNEAARHALALDYFKTQFQAVFLLPRSWWGSRKSFEKTARVHGGDALNNAIDEGRPVVLLITHSVALDAGLIAMSNSYSLHGIYKPLTNEVLDWLVMRARLRFGGVPVARGNGLRALLEALAGGKLLCYLSDEDLGPKGSVFAPFFNRQKCTLTMLPRIVQKTDAQVFPLISHVNVEDDGIDVHVLPPLEHYPTMSAIADATQLNVAIEKTIRLNPAQFMWNLRLFKTCPNGKLTRYGQIERGEISVEDL